ncbi:hypothetical protein OL599_25140, partial [Rhodovastum sp. RN2-1]|nr:hypothetical protein [Limobrevibacterium gyesilva]
SLNAPEIRDEAAEALRSLIERVALTPDPTAPDGLAAELHGELAMILKLATSAEPSGGGRRGSGTQNEKLPRTDVLGSQLSLVAGTRYRRSHHSTVAIWP